MVEIPSIGLPIVDMATIDLPCIGETFFDFSSGSSSAEYFTLDSSLLNGDDVLM